MNDHLQDAREIIAKAVTKTVDPHAGWTKYNPGGDAAICALIEAGWTPPGEGTEDDRLRKTVLAEQELTRLAYEAVARTEAERDAAGAFRIRFLDGKRQLQQHLTAAREAALIAHDPEPTYTGGQVLEWLSKILDHADNAADRAKAKSLKQKQAIP